MKYFKFFIVLLFIGIILYIYQNDYQNYLSLDYAKNSLKSFKDYDLNNPIQSKLIFFFLYVLVTSLSLPGATVLTLFAGALFGWLNGSILVSFASSLGACLAFISSRYLFRDLVQSRFNKRYHSISEGFTRDGIFYLISLRLIPIFPFFLVNLLMGLTKIKLITFYWVSQVGMLAATIVYVQAGEQLSQINNLKDISNPKLILIFTLLGLLPWFFKFFINYLKVKKVYANYNKPKKFEYNTVVIGAGAAGLVSSYISAAVKAKVALIESNKMGGDCLNYGCVPSKAIIKSAKVASVVRAAALYGIETAAMQVNFLNVMNRIKAVIKQIEPHDSIKRYSEIGVECIIGEAKVMSPFEVKVNDRVLTTKNIIIAAGAEPIIPKISGLDKIKYLSSENLWELTELPKEFLIVGGGAIGCELAQSFQRLGSQVTLLERENGLIGRSDLNAADIILNKLKSEGIKILLQAELLEFIDANSAIIKKDNIKESLKFSHILFALGRRARSESFALENLKLELNPNGTLKHNEFLQTKFPNVYVCGDVAGPIQLTHMAAHQAWYAAVNALFSPFKKFKTDYRVVPSVIFTDPEVAQVGMTINQANEKNIKFEETFYETEDLDRAICEGELTGFVKILTDIKSDKIIGATIVGPHAGELIAEISIAMRWNLGLNKILSTVHSYPTWSESLKMTAGRWRQNNKPEILLRIVQKFHQIRRG